MSTLPCVQEPVLLIIIAIAAGGGFVIGVIYNLVTRR